MDRLGKLVRAKRVKRKETLEQLAKSLDCSVGFAKHIESSRIVPISPRLIKGLKRRYKFEDGLLEMAAELRRKTATRYYRNYRKSS